MEENRVGGLAGRTGRIEARPPLPASCPSRCSGFLETGIPRFHPRAGESLDVSPSNIDASRAAPGGPPVEARRAKGEADAEVRACFRSRRRRSSAVVRPAKAASRRRTQCLPWNDAIAPAEPRKRSRGPTNRPLGRQRDGRTRDSRGRKATGGRRGTHTLGTPPPLPPGPLDHEFRSRPGSEHRARSHRAPPGCPLRCRRRSRCGGAGDDRQPPHRRVGRREPQRRQG